MGITKVSSQAVETDFRIYLQLLAFISLSLAILNLQLERPADKAEINRYLRQVSLTSPLRQQIDYIESPEVVSTDFVGSNRAGIVDGLATIADGTDAVLYVWYDNEYGYSCQVVRVIEAMAGTHPVVLPERQPVLLARETLPVG